MEQERIQELITKYNEGLADPSEIKLVEQLIEEGKIDLSQLEVLQKFETQVMKMEFPQSSPDLDTRFYEMLRLTKEEHGGFSWKSFFSWPELAPRLALASIMLIVGVAIGLMFKPTGNQEEVLVLSQQVSDLKEMMMLSLLEKESATDRLKAVSLTSEMNDASEKVTRALIQTLNQDENINVRLAALDALKHYVRNSEVREELIRSIAVQQSPLVQVALAEVMAAIQEKSSVKEFEKILKSDKTPPDVKKKIEENLKVMS